MNYNDSILENKEFAFFKQLIYNIALSVCVLLLLAIILVYGFNFKLYHVMSDSESPIFTKGDMVVVKKQDKYEIGDIVQFKYALDDPVAHRLIGIKADANGVNHYIFHGDAVGSANPINSGKTAHWKDDAAYVANLTLEDVKDGKAWNCQVTTEKEIWGEVVCWFENYGNYFNFIKSHKLLIITIVVGIWSINGVIQNELEMRKSRRLEL